MPVQIPTEPGCYASGTHGRYAVTRMLILAHEWGWTPVEGAQYLSDIIEAHDSDAYVDTIDAIDSLVDEAQDWLNDHTPDGLIWHWHDGEFFLSRYCGTDGCEDSECACQDY